MGENLFRSGFIWYQRASGLAVEPDPRFINFEIMLAKSSPKFFAEKVQSAELEKISLDKHSEFFSEGSYFKLMADFSPDGKTTNILTLKDPHSYSIRDAISSFNSEYLAFQVHRCNNATSTVTCADFGENEENLGNYLAQYNMALITITNFINYDEVDPFVGPMKHIEEWTRAKPIELKKDRSFEHEIAKLVEHKINLEDSLI